MSNPIRSRLQILRNTLRRSQRASSAGLTLLRHPELLSRVIRLRLTLPRRMREQALHQLLDELDELRPATALPLPVIGQVTGLLLDAPSPLRTTCLFRALIRFALMPRHDDGMRFCMGLQPGGDQPEGHAWIERAGQPLFGDSSRQCVVTYSYPDSSR